MLYDIRLVMSYRYGSQVAGGRHVIRVLPLNLPVQQRVVAATVSFDPQPAERSDAVDFFGNALTSIAFRQPHDALEIRMAARVQVDRERQVEDRSSALDGLARDIETVRDIGGESPHHFLAASPLVAADRAIALYAQQAIAGADTVGEAAMRFCRRIHRDFEYDPKATDVDTPTSEAFSLRRGVCQDFSHVMIAGLRGLGIPAGYVSGFLRTIPPPGKERLEGADAMHAWTRVWCGLKAGWLEFDPTNAIAAGNDHIVVGYGRDYSDVAPIAGVLRTTGNQKGKQAVDVVPVE